MVEKSVTGGAALLRGVHLGSLPYFFIMKEAKDNIIDQVKPNGKQGYFKMLLSTGSLNC